MITYQEKPHSDEQTTAILNPIMKKWFFTKFKSFTEAQKHAVYNIHSRNNILVSSPTGSGKTLCSFTAVLNELVDLAEKKLLEDKVYCIYISPLKALSMDIEKNLKEPLDEISEIAGKKLGIRVGVRTGDTTTSQKSAMLKKPPHILITTPESLSIVLSSYKFVENLKGIEWAIIDEVHALAENKRGVHLSLSLERLNRISPGMTRVGLSATIAPLEEIAKFLVGFENGKIRNCIIADVQITKKMDLKVISPTSSLIDVSHGEIHHSLYEKIDELVQNHKTTIIFTNTRSATERVVHHLKEKFPAKYVNNPEGEIGAHHGSLSKEYRHKIEEDLRNGKLKAVVSSTSLELGIDIGYVDLVILLGSPKSVARAIQRIGRSGHKLHETPIGRIIVLDRDDLVECSLILKSAIEKKIDKIHLPKNCLDVLAQNIFGIAIAEKIYENELYTLIKQSYSFSELTRTDFKEVLDYLSGKYISLEDRHIYAKIWHDEETKTIGKKGKMSRVIYMTNIGTIPNESFILVKIGEQTIGKIDEVFLEKLKRGDVFVLGGEKYEFLFAKGMVAYVKSSVNRAPTIPSWFSETLPLSFDLAMEIGKFRRLMEEQFLHNKSREEIIQFIDKYLYVDSNAANSIYEFFREQHMFLEIPHDKKIIIETYSDPKKKYAVFHTLYGRRVNDCLSRAIALAISRSQHRDVEIGITDNGFYFAYSRNVNVQSALKLIQSDKFESILNTAIDKTEVLKRRFRHCAARSLMILKNYKGTEKRVGRQQVSSMILLNAVKRISNNFSILKEARREVLEDLMDIQSAKFIIQEIENGKIKIKEKSTTIPSPFAFSIALQGYTDVLKMEDRMAFLRRMHKDVLERIRVKGKA